MSNVINSDVNESYFDKGSVQAYDDKEDMDSEDWAFYMESAGEECIDNEGDELSEDECTVEFIDTCVSKVRYEMYAFGDTNEIVHLIESNKLLLQLRKMYKEYNDLFGPYLDELQALAAQVQSALVKMRKLQEKRHKY